MDVIDITENNKNNITTNSLIEIPNVSYKIFMLILILMLFYNNIKYYQSCKFSSVRLINITGLGTINSVRW